MGESARLDVLPLVLWHTIVKAKLAAKAHNWAKEDCQSQCSKHGFECPWSAWKAQDRVVLEMRWEPEMLPKPIRKQSPSCYRRSPRRSPTNFLYLNAYYAICLQCSTSTVSAARASVRIASNASCALPCMRFASSHCGSKWVQVGTVER